MKKISLLVATYILTLGIAVSLPSLASALLITSDQYAIGGSWTQPGWSSIHETLEFDAIEAFIIEGATDFVDPGLEELPSDWVATLQHPDYSLATGSSTSLSFSTHFTADIDVSFTMDLLGHSGSWTDDDGNFQEGTVIDSSRCIWTWNPVSGAGSWSFTSVPEYTDHECFRISVPDAGMVWLLGSAFIGFAVFGIKKSKTRNGQRVI